MVEATIPEGKELPVDPAVLEPLIRAALLAGVQGLRVIYVLGRASTVYRAANVGMGFIRDEAEMPSYFRIFPEDPDDSQAIRKSEAARALTDYLWSRGQLKKTIHGENPATFRDGWASAVWDELILRTIWYLANRAVTEDFALGREHVQWRVDANDVDDAISELVGLLCKDSVIVTAVCPIRHAGFAAPLIGSELESGVTLDPWMAEPQQAVFLTRFHEEFMPDDSVLWQPWSALRIRLALPVKINAIEAVGAIIDRFLWTTMIQRNTTSVPSLGNVVLRSATRHVRTTIFRPDEPWITSTVKPVGWAEGRTVPGIYADAEFVMRARENLGALKQASTVTSELATAVWSFGRSCSAQSPRDVLLEAAIGLERLLVPEGPGDIAYKFRLHGAALLTDEPTAFHDLKEIYKLRSKAAHGSAGTGSAAFDSIAPRARRLLALAIQASALLINSGELAVAGQHIGDAISDLVRRRATSLGTFKVATIHPPGLNFGSLSERPRSPRWRLGPGRRPPSGRRRAFPRRRS